jgi:hypothetical protein
MMVSTQYHLACTWWVAPHNYFASGLQKALHHKLILAQAKVITASQSTCTIVFVIFTKRWKRNRKQQKAQKYSFFSKIGLG